MKQKTVRETALDLLVRIDKQGGFSHLLISDAIKKQRIDARDETLLTEIVYGTTERKITLDFYLEAYIKKQKKMSDWVRTLLRMSVYQFAYLDKVPAFAIINEAVNIAKKRGHQGIASFVNGVLRNIDRNGLKSTADITDPVEQISIETSHPVWLVKRWADYYGIETAAAICKENMKRKSLSIRVNQLKTDRHTLLERLDDAGIEAVPSSILEEAVILEKGNIFKTDLLDSGEATVQDISSMLAAKAVEAEPGMKVLDACSAPGGKTTYIGEAMQQEGDIYAYDLHENKLNLIKKSAHRLGINNVNVQAQDARTLQTVHEAETFDRILVDAPCSGFGVIRSKPDIKYQKTEKDILQLKQVQHDILNQVAPLVKTSGKIVYSTCTIEKEENEWQVKAFLEKNEGFVVDETFLTEMKGMDEVHLTEYGVQILPQSFHSDGFFITRLVKRSS